MHLLNFQNLLPFTVKGPLYHLRQIHADSIARTDEDGGLLRLPEEVHLRIQDSDLERFVAVVAHTTDMHLLIWH